MEFHEAVIELTDGNKIRRTEWDNKEEVAYIKDGFLRLFRNDKEHNFILSEADMIATDWVVVESEDGRTN